MQRIERYGVIALALLLVTIAAVSFWDDGGLTSKDKKKQSPRSLERIAQQDARRSAQTPSSHLPATAGKKDSRTPAKRKTKPTQTPRRSIVAPKQTPSKPYTTLPATVVSQPVRTEFGGGRTAGEVEFPESLKKGGTRERDRELARQDPTPVRTTNYDSIQGSEEVLSAKTPQQVPAPVVTQPTTGLSTYTVVGGDTLSQISYKTLGTSKRWREIQALNGNLDPSALYAGAVLKIPSGAAAPAGRELPTLIASEREPQSLDGYYIVRKGDVLSQIAQDELGGASRWREIAALNPSIDPNVLQEGERLRMPTSTAVASRFEPSAPVRTTKKKNRVR